jgi:Ferritin-like
MAHDSIRTFPRNLTARAAHRVTGNPDCTRPEDAVANCYPGLESDVRNLDRRFFPGLVFNFVNRTDSDAPWSEPLRYGAQLAYTDPYGDSDLQPNIVAKMDESVRKWIEPLAKSLRATLAGDVGTTLSTGTWHIKWVKQHEKCIDLMQVLPDGRPAGLDGLVVWRLIRGLEPGPVTIALHQRETVSAPVVLQGWRRIFADPRTGVLSEAYQAGELTQALCSPWQHDFRDCNCHYWPANRPDIVHIATKPGAPILPNGRPADPEQALLLVDWLRADRDAAVAATVQNVLLDNRPYQMDYYQINRTWTELSVVLNDTEIGATYTPPVADTAQPYASPAQLAEALRTLLAPVEMTLAIEYIYARFSLVSDTEAVAKARDWPGLRDDVLFARHMLMLTAGDEMQHLRWANEILWKLADAGLTAPYIPVLTPSLTVPCMRSETRNRELRRLDMKTLEDFIAIEHPRSTIEADYARVATTLRNKVYPQHLSELATRTVSGGLDHFTRLREVKAVLRAYDGADPPPYLRDLQLGNAEETKPALDAYHNIRDSLTQAYGLMAQGLFAKAGQEIAAARTAMNTLLREGEALAAEHIGVPFW